MYYQNDFIVRVLNLWIIICLFENLDFFMLSSISELNEYVKVIVPKESIELLNDSILK